MKTNIKEISTPGYEKVISFEESDLGLKGLIAVHSTKLGPSLGGVRMRAMKQPIQKKKGILSV